MRYRPEHLMIVGFITVAAIIIFITVVSVETSARLTILSGWVSHTQEVQTELAHTRSLINETQTACRVYMLLGRNEDLSDYQRARTRILVQIDRVAALTADNSSQQKRIATLRAALLTPFDRWKEAISLRQNRGEAAAHSLLSTGLHERLIAAPRQIAQEMDREESRLLRQRTTAYHHYLWRITYLLIGLCLVVLIALTLVYFGVRHILWAREQAHHEASLADAALQNEARRMGEIITIQQELALAEYDLHAVMQIVTERTQAITCAEGGVIELIDGNELVYRAATGTATPHIGLRLQVAGSLSGQCVRENQGIKCEDSELDDRVDRNACRRIGVRSMIVVPLYHNHEAIGVLKVFSSRACAFGASDMTVLQLMAGVIAAAMSQAITIETKQALFDERANTLQTLQRSEQQLQRMNDQLEQHMVVVNEQSVLLEVQKAELEEANARWQALATTDGLTGVYNRRAFQERAEQEFATHCDDDLPLSIVLLDVDKFKEYNDTFGHPAGDQVLKKIASVLQASSRSLDFAARYGGEEFVVILPGTDAQGARAVAERVRTAIAAHEWSQRAITVSVGVSSRKANSMDVAMLIDEADKALYVSKVRGRNRVTIYEEVMHRAA